jgi:FG-GAP-like repeat
MGSIRRVRLPLAAALVFVLALASASGGGSVVGAWRAATAIGLPEYRPAAQAGNIVPTDPATVPPVNFLAVADFNADGRPDILAARSLYQSGQRFSVAVLVNRGDGTFGDETSSVFEGSVPTTLEPRRLIVADFNGDGRPDVFIADEGQDVPPSLGYQNTLILSAPGGKLVDATANLPQRWDFSHGAAAADVNGDGSIDLFVGNLGRANSSVLLNDGTGRFHDEPNGIPAKLADPGQSIITSAVFADVNRDGFQDLIAGGGSNGLYSTVPVVLLNNGHGAFPSVSSALPLPPFGFNSPVDFQAADLNGDGFPDLVASYVKTPGSTGRWIQVLINNGDGTFRDETQARLPQSDNDESWIKEIRLVDLNRDGAPDIATAVVPKGPPWDEPPPFYLNDGHGYFTALPAGLGLGAGDTYSFIDATGQSERDIVYTKNNVNVEILREHAPNGGRLYGTVAEDGTISLVVDQGPHSPIRAGLHQIVVWDQNARAPFVLVGPGVNFRTGARYKSITFWTVRLRAGATYRYRSDRIHHGTVRITR